MKQPVLTISAFTITLFLSGQSQLMKNDIYLEAGGAGLFGSVNYERQLTKEPGLGIRAGVGFYSEHAFYLTIPAGINYLFQLKNDTSYNQAAFIDAGLTVTWTRLDGKLFGASGSANGGHFVNFIPSIGYRKHTRQNIMWRISLSPAINKFTFVPWAGVSIGKRF